MALTDPPVDCPAKVVTTPALTRRVVVAVGVGFDGELGWLFPQEDNNAPPKIKKDPHATKALLFITAPVFSFLNQNFFSPHSGQ